MRRIGVAMALAMVIAVLSIASAAEAQTTKQDYLLHSDSQALFRTLRIWDARVRLARHAT